MFCFVHVVLLISLEIMRKNVHGLNIIFKNILRVRCVFQFQPSAILCASGSTQGGEVALIVVSFRIMHRLGRPHYMCDEYLYSVLEKVEVMVTVSVTVCVV